MTEEPASSRSDGQTAPSAGRGRHWTRVIGAVALTVVGVLVVAGLAPLALQEQRGTGPVADTAAALPGQAAGWDHTPLSSSKTTLTGSVDALATAARNRGYRCETPQIQTIRACTRSAGGYFFDLWLQGTDTYVTTIYLSVTAIYRTQTRSHWVDEMAVVLTWIDTAQGGNLSSWLAASADAPGADAYVDGLRVSFFVRADEWTKETFGDIAADCGHTIDDISTCDPSNAPYGERWGF